MLNGDGLRVVLWVAGCSHHCPGCQNPVTWDPEGGAPFTEAEKQEIFRELDKDYVSGITFSGGDPLHHANISEVTSLAAEIRRKYPDKTIWVYTGYEWEDICTVELMQYADVVVDGPFIEEERDVTLHWKGSPNQRVIDVRRSVPDKEVVLWDDNDGSEPSSARGACDR